MVDKTGVGEKMTKPEMTIMKQAEKIVLIMVPCLNASMCEKNDLSFQTGIARVFIQASNTKTGI